jgi:hypothetical protein
MRREFLRQLNKKAMLVKWSRAKACEVDSNTVDNQLECFNAEI